MDEMSDLLELRLLTAELDEKEKLWINLESSARKGTETEMAFKNKDEELNTIIAEIQENLAENESEKQSGGAVDECAPELRSNSQESLTVRYNNLHQEAIKFVEEGAKSMHIYKVAVDALQEAVKKVAAAKKQNSRATQGGTLANGGNKDMHPGEENQTAPYQSAWEVDEMFLLELKLLTAKLTEKEARECIETVKNKEEELNPIIAELQEYLAERESEKQDEKGHIQEQEKLRKNLESLERECTETEVAMKKEEAELNAIIAELRMSNASLQVNLAKQESEKLVRL